MIVDSSASTHLMSKVDFFIRGIRNSESVTTSHDTCNPSQTKPTRGKTVSISQDQEERAKAHVAVHNSRIKGYASSLDRWTRDDRYRESQFSTGRTEDSESLGVSTIAARSQKDKFKQIYIMSRNSDGRSQECKNPHHPEFVQATKEDCSR